MVATLAVASATRLAAQASSLNNDIVITSRELGDQRRVWVRLPPNYELHGRQLPLTIVLDGDDQRLLDLAVSAARFTSTLDAFDPETPEQIVVGVESHERGRDFGKNAGAMSRFITGELIPFLSRTYRVAGPHVIVGHSLAGAFALDVMCNSPSTIRAVVAVSPALSDSVDVARAKSCMTKFATAVDGPEHAVFVAVGSRAHDGTEDQFRPNILAVFNSPNSSIDTRKSRVHTRLVQLPDVSHSRTPLFGFPAGLSFVNAEWGRAAFDSVTAALLSGKIDPLIALDSVAKLRVRRGDAGTASARWRHFATLILTGNRPADAARVAREAIVLYPERIELYDALANACTKLRDTACARTAAAQGVAMTMRRAELVGSASPTLTLGAQPGSFFAISVANIDSMSAWYKRVFGFSAYSEGTVPDRGVKFALLHQGSAIIELLQLPDAKPRATIAPATTADYQIHGIFKGGFVVENIDSAYAIVKGRGITFAYDLGKPPNGPYRSFGVRDPEGNLIQVFGR